MGIKIAAVIPTHNRPQMLANRAIASVASQTRKPDYLFVVDDSDSKVRKLNKEVVATRKAAEETHYLENYRSRGACGAWNTAFSRLLSLTPADVRDLYYVALLDDDDSWEPTYLEQCATMAEQAGLDVVVAHFNRVASGGPEPQEIQQGDLIPETFLVTNPGWQGSNTFVRFTALLKAGCFDENQASTNDRDLAIRLLNIPGIRCGVIPELLVTHYADEDREQLSKPASPQKKAGLQAFYAKYSQRMDEAGKTLFKSRADDPFKVPVEDPCLIEKGEGQIADYGTPETPTLGRLLIGCIASKNIEIPKCLVDNIAELAQKAPKTVIQTLLLANDYAPHSHEWAELHRHCDKIAAETSNQCMFTLLSSGKSGNLSIAEARFMLQQECYKHLEENHAPNAVPVWILDDDARFDIPTFGQRGPFVASGLNHIAMIEELSKTGADVVIGSVYGEPPLPFISTIRVQLLDLLYNLQRVNSLVQQNSSCLDAPYRFNFAHNQKCRERYEDFYYDLSRVDTGHLEVPFWYEPNQAGLSVAGAFSEMISRLDGLFAGRQVFRNLLWTPENLSDTLLPKFTRGPNTLIFTRRALKDIPNIAPKLQGKYTRRSDMNWALLCHFAENLRVEMASFPVRQDRSATKANYQFGIDTFIQDIRGYAIHSALYATLMAERAKNLETRKCEDGLQVLDYSGERLHEALRLTKKFLVERLKAFEMNRYRIVGLLEVLQKQCHSGFWATNPRFGHENGLLQDFLTKMAAVQFGAMENLGEDAQNIPDEDILRFFKDIRCKVALSKRALYEG